MTLFSVSVNISESSVAAQGASWGGNTDRSSPGLWTQSCRAFNHNRYRTEQCPNAGTTEVNYQSHFPALQLFVCSSSALLFSLTHCLTNHTALPGPLTYLSPWLKSRLSTLVVFNRCFCQTLLKQDHIHKCGSWQTFILLLLLPNLLPTYL